MQQPDGFGPTVPAHPPVARLPSGRTLIAAGVGAALIVGLVIGIVVGRASKRDGVAPAQANPQIAQLGVTSKPVDANVVVDGRFVGVSPVERIDLDPGKHSIVIDTFGYQPYAGTVEVEPRARATLKVVLAPIGARDATNGEVVGVKKSSNVVIPPTALAPISLTGTGTSKDAAKPAGTSSPPRRSSSPSPPKRDCGGEKSRCRDSCSSADSSCRFGCPGCTSCLTSVGWEECKRQCDSCRQGCEQNVKFCESSCDSNYSNCSASQ